jgi:hypothetical protein
LRRARPVLVIPGAGSGTLRLEGGSVRSTKGDCSMASRVKPHPGILLYTRIKKSPYYYGARRHGVQLYSVYNHHYHPRLFRDPIEEYRAGSYSRE